MEEGPTDHVGESRLRLDMAPSLVNGVCSQEGQPIAVDSGEWMEDPRFPQHTNGNIGWDETQVVNQVRNHVKEDLGASGDNGLLGDDRKLSSFPETAVSLPLYNSPAHNPQPLQKMNLTEKCNAEINNSLERVQLILPMSDECTPDDDLSTLTSTWGLPNKHGKKTVPYTCDGPDYLEWFERKIKAVIDVGENRTSELSDKTNEVPVENGALQNHMLGLEETLLFDSSDVPQYSQNALNIAKEKNISLQTAIAIEALTQLSSTLPQPFLESSPQINISSQTGDTSSSSVDDNLAATDELQDDRRPEQRPPSQNPVLQQPLPGHQAFPEFQAHEQTPWDHLKKPAPSEAHYVPPALKTLQDPFSGFSNSVATVKHDDAGASRGNEGPGGEGGGQACNIDQPNAPLNDPMSELKQLLDGNNGNKYPAARLRAPGAAEHHDLTAAKTQQDLPLPFPNLPAGAGFYGMFPEHQQQQSLQSMQQLQMHQRSKHQKTQAALQQHLHHKRNLFQEQNPKQNHLHHEEDQQQQQQQQRWSHHQPHLKRPKQKKPVQEKRKLQPPQKQRKDAAQLHKAQNIQQQLFMHQLQQMQQGKPQQQQQDAQCQPLPQAKQVPEGYQQVGTTHNSYVAGENPQPQLFKDCPMQSGLHPTSDGPLQKQPESSKPGVPCGSPNFDGSVPPKMCALQPDPFSCSHRHPQSPSLKSSPVRQPETRAASEPPAPPLLQQGEMPMHSPRSFEEKIEELLKQFEAEFECNSAAQHQQQHQQQQPQFPGHNHPTSQVETNGNQTPSAGLHHYLLDRPTPSAPSSHKRIPHEQTGCKPPPLQADDTLRENTKCFNNSFLSGSSKQVKVESSGAITVLSTVYSGENMEAQSEEGTPTKNTPLNPSLSGFLDSPLKYLNTPTKSLLDTPSKKAQMEFPTCDCVEQIIEKEEGPYYTHLGSGPTVASIRELMEERYGEKGKAVRIEKVIYTGKEGKSSQGCPIAKWIIRRTSKEEKVLCLVRERAGHHCQNAVVIILILAWEGIPRSLGDKLYDELTETLTKYGNPTCRRCGLNDDRTCACQGKDPETCGASFSFGCSWSMYFNGCKYARSKLPRKFRLLGDNPKEEDLLKDRLQALATEVAPLYKQLAPQSFSNQITNEQLAPDCRLGKKEGKPFSGVTACMDFCAHAHKDQHNMYNGCTVVCTLTKEDNRQIGTTPEDEQLHVLPLYKVSATDEHGSELNQSEKIKAGAIEVLTAFPREVRMLPEPVKSARQKKLEAKRAAEKQRNQEKKLLAGKLKQEAENLKCGTPQNKDVTLGSATPQHHLTPSIKIEPQDHYNSYKHSGNSVVESYTVLGNCRPSNAYNLGNAYPYHSYYARPSLPSINNYHPRYSFSYGYYGYPSNQLFPPSFLNYGSGDTRPASFSGNGFEKKPDVQELCANFNLALRSNRIDCSEQGGDMTPKQSHQPMFQGGAGLVSPSPLSAQSHLPEEVKPASQNANSINRFIKQEPEDPVPYSQSCHGASRNVHPVNNTYPPVQMSPGLGHQGKSWDVFKPNGSLMSTGTSGHDKPWSLYNSTDSTKLANTNVQERWNSITSNRSANGCPVSNMQEKPWNLHTESRGTPPMKSVNHQGTMWDSFKSGEATSMASNVNLKDKLWEPVKIQNNLSVISGSSLQDKTWDLYKRNGSKSLTSNMSLRENVWSENGAVFPGGTMEGKQWDLYKVNESGPVLHGSGIQEQLWDPYGMNENMDDLPPENVKEEEEEVWSDSEHNFLDGNIGGVAVAPAHGSILIECARRELHATTPLKKPNRSHPTRISLVFYQHKNLNEPNHGLALWEAKVKILAERAKQRQEEAARLGLPLVNSKLLGKKRKWGSTLTTDIDLGKKDFFPTRQALTITTNTVITVSSYAYTQVTGPYNRWI
ncbi:methylcytosine dioxygenase tet3-like isoform X3 [Leucoraja erinacea]|nr:methylcytosine dioxygenase tet3-like isoform X3 [Leucoraja erinacea]XP_055518280.1 methylcytosine dioxygenase tet3-like isoform X3 [Leucoraja erinacea]XP_055518281.1 methylcytosine dioxygenase tet3-like isoform X3 [Leucoraja erinacea]